MWPRNELTERLKLEWPILQAPMGGTVTPALAAAVSGAGGLGGLGMWGFSAADAGRWVQTFRQLTGGSLNVNYPLWEHPGDLTGVGMAMRQRIQALYDEKGLGALAEPEGSAGVVSADHLDMLLDVRPEVVSFHFGFPPPDIVRALKGAGILVLSSATTVAEARRLEAAGADAVIAQGAEAGGHRGTFTGVDISMQPGLFALLPRVVDAVQIPVIAAGGIADGRGIAAAFMLGASAVQLGTAFLRCDESNIHDGHRAALGNADESGTVVTDVVSGRPARFIRNRLIDELSAGGAAPLPFPAQLGLTYPMGVGGDPSLSVLFAGQAAGLAPALPAAELVRRLADETTRRLGDFR